MPAEDNRPEKYKSVADLRQYDRKWRVTSDGTNASERVEEVWELCIQGKYGQIYPAGYNGDIAICVTSSKMLAKVCPILGIQTPEHSAGDEHVFRFKNEPDVVNKLATIIRASKSRKGRAPNQTPEQRAKAIAALKAWQAARKAAGQPTQQAA